MYTHTQTGPFVDANHAKIRTGDIEVSLDDLFKCVPMRNNVPHVTYSH